MSEQEIHKDQQVETVGGQHDVVRFHLRTSEETIARGSGRMELLKSQEGLLDSGTLSVYCDLGDEEYAVGADFTFSEDCPAPEWMADIAVGALEDLSSETSDSYVRICEYADRTTLFTRYFHDGLAIVNIAVNREGISFQMLYGEGEGDGSQVSHTALFDDRSPRDDALVLLRTVYEVMNDFHHRTNEKDRINAYFELPPEVFAEPQHDDPLRVPAARMPLALESGRLTAEEDEAEANEDETESKSIRKSAFDRFGGLDREIQELQAVLSTWQNPELCREYDIPRPTGILLHGPGGVGKTELARAVAEEMESEMTEVRTSDIISKWVGEPAQNLRKVFNGMLDEAGFKVVLFDEFDGLFNKNASGNEGVAKNLISEFKTILSNLHNEYPDVLVIATCNSIEGFDPALLRPGRFDTVLQIGLPNTESRAAIIGKFLHNNYHLYDMPAVQDDELDIERLFDRTPRSRGIDFLELAQQTDGLSGADIEAALTDARRAKMLAHMATGQKQHPVTQREIEAAIEKLRRSRSSGSD